MGLDVGGDLPPVIDEVFTSKPSFNYLINTNSAINQADQNDVIYGDDRELGDWDDDNDDNDPHSINDSEYEYDDSFCGGNDNDIDGDIDDDGFGSGNDGDMDDDVIIDEVDDHGNNRMDVEGDKGDGFDSDMRADDLNDMTSEESEDDFPGDIAHHPQLTGTQYNELFCM